MSRPSNSSATNLQISSAAGIPTRDVDALEEHVESRLNAHRLNKNIYATLDRLINIPLLLDQTLIAATADAPVNFDLPFSGTPPVHITLTTQILGVVGALLATVNSFVEPGKTHEQHIQAEKSYNSVQTRLLQLRALTSYGTPDEVRQEYLKVIQEVEKADSSAPDIFFDPNSAIYGGGGTPSKTPQTIKNSK